MFVNYFHITVKTRKIIKALHNNQALPKILALVN